MILKEYFTDGLLQIAIVLSLLRTDLHNYINSNLVQYPEVQDIILGPTAAISQTNFHSYDNQLHSFHGSLKGLENEESFILRDLRSLSRLSNYQIFSQNLRGFPAFLVGLTGNSENTFQTSGTSTVTIPATASLVETNNNSTNNSTDEGEEESHSSLLTTLQDLETDEGFEDVVFGADHLQRVPNDSDDLTHEDLDLIDVLWRQDIDLGVGKEVFDINLRRELERERELELQKERQKQKERELLQVKLDEQRRRQQQQWVAENFMQDGETGEWVPLNGRRAPPAQTVTAPQNQSASLHNVTSPPGPHSTALHNVTSPSMPHASPQMPPVIKQNNSLNITHSNQFQGYMSYDNNMPMPSNYHQSSPLVQQPHGHQMAVQEGQYHVTSPEHSMSYQQNTNSSSLQQNFSYNQPPLTQQVEYPRQESLEQTWQDLVNLLELPSNESTNTGNMTSNIDNNNLSQGNMMSMQQGMMSPQANMSSGSMSSNMMTPPNNHSMTNHSGLMSPQSCHSNPLLQNATLPQPVNTTVTTPSFDPVPRTSTNLSSSTPSDDCSSSLDWDPRNLMFPNPSSPIDNMDGNGTFAEVDNILSNMIDEGLDITELALNDGLRSMQMLDDSSSESGVSMGSTGSPAQDQFSDSAMSPFDGLEGATGGKDLGDNPSFKKGSDKFNYSNGGYNFNNDNGAESQSNYSSSSNDTDFNYAHTGSHHIQHNHSYPLKPGQEPREYKKYTLTDKPRQKGPHCRDKKRIEELKIPLTLEQIIESPVEEFNELLTRHKLSEPQLQLIRDIRRRGKNKVAAQNCRKRKMDVIVNLEDEMSFLKDQKEKLLSERHMIDKQTRDMKEKFSLLYREIFQSLRDEHGRPYDPHHFSLQQSSDGNVFLVPRNITADEQQAKINKKIKEEKKDN